MRMLIYKAQANTITVFVNLNISSRYYDILFEKCLLKHNTRVVVLALDLLVFKVKRLNSALNIK